MKRTMFVALALLLGLALWIIKVGWAQKSNPDDAGQREQKNWFEINAWGTLKVVRNKEGKVIFGPGRPPNEGYSIAYQRLHPRTRKPIEAPKVFFAVGERYSERQLLCEECEKRRKRQPDQAVATVTTTDGVLRVNSGFYFMEEEGKLQIIRTIENISKNPVQLISIRAQYDARLGSNVATQFGKVKPEGQHKSSQAQPQFAPSNAFISSFIAPAAPVFFPSCTPCPPDCDPSLIASAGEKELICVECPEDGNSVLEYMTSKIPVGQEPQKPTGECEHSIMVDVWNGQVIVGGKPDDRGIGEIICVDCPKTGGETLIVQPITSPGNALDQVKKLRADGQCQLAIHVDNSGSQPTIPKGGKANDGHLGSNEQLAVIEILSTQSKW